MNMFVESFDSYNGIGTNTGLLSRWTVTGTALSGARTGMVAGRFGTGQAFNSGSGSSSSIHRTQCQLADRNGNPFTLTSFAMHCAMRPKSVTADGTEMSFVPLLKYLLRCNLVRYKILYFLYFYSMLLLGLMGLLLLRLLRRMILPVYWQNSS